MIGRLKEAYEYRDLLRELVYQQLHQRYQGSVLGFLWTLVLPLLTFGCFSVIFSFLNHWELKDYGIYFFSGYIFWILFSNSCLGAAESVVGISDAFRPLPERRGLYRPNSARNARLGLAGAIPQRAAAFAVR